MVTVLIRPKNQTSLFKLWMPSQIGRRRTQRKKNIHAYKYYRHIMVLEQYYEKKVREKSRECHNHKPQPFPDIKRKKKTTNPNKHKSIKHTKSTKISSLFPKRGNRNAKGTEKHKNKMAQGKTYNKSPRRKQAYSNVLKILQTKNKKKKKK